jgi:hypothetical protein
VRLDLFVFIDAFGWELLRRHPFLDDRLVVKAPLGTLLGYSSTCDPTILTGRLPREHGHFSFFYHSPATSPFRILRLLGALPRAVTRRGRVRRVISRAVQRAYGYTGYFQLYNMPFGELWRFDYSEKRDLYTPGGINGGQATIFDRLREQRIPFHVSDWRRGEEENLRALGEAVDRGEIRFAYLYMAAMDAVLHADGTGSARVAEKIAWYDRQLRALLARAEARYDEVRLAVFSDHGMTNVTAECDLMARLRRLPLVFGTDYAAVYDSTMARFWFLRPGAREAIAAALQEEPRGRILSEADLAAYGCDFPDRKYGELFFLLEPGVLLNPSFMGEAYLPGMHGYDPYDKDSLAMFASTYRPAVQPRGLTDLYGLMRRAADGEEPAAPGGAA